ncbi:MAG: hypothetical protein WDN28_26490 [Chthoniobacter sp.]
MGDRGYLDWGQKLAKEIQAALASSEADGLDFAVKQIPLQAGTQKGVEAILGLGAIAVGIAGATAYSIDALKTTKVLTAIWTILKKALPRGCNKVTVTYERSASGKKTVKERFKLDTSADSPEAAHSLLRAGQALLESLQAKPSSSENVTITFAPEKP